MLHYKKFNAYEDYVKAQVASPMKIEEYLRRKSERKLTDFLADFVRFDGFIPDGCRVLCLGARFGEEVRAFRKLGYDAVGIDLWADEEDLVIKGDWNNLPFEKEFDVIYTNSIDHTNDIETLIDQIEKALKSVGIVIIALDQNHTHAGSDNMIARKFAHPDRYEAMLWNKDEDVIKAFTGFEQKKSWIERRWHTFLLERNNGTTV
ncbi:MAG: class I SAM-dependent methyltransferase [Planctomycetota bacterium]|jgi:SAM-dependent methyltransferase